MTTPKLEEIQQVTQIFKMLSDPTRLKILLSLQEGERNVTSIAEQVQMEQSAVSHQLKLLKDNRIVKSERQGKRFFIVSMTNMLWIFCKKHLNISITVKTRARISQKS